MNRIFLSCGGRRGRSTRKRLALGKGKVFGQKVGAEISCSRISSGREGGEVGEKPILEALPAR